MLKLTGSVVPDEQVQKAIAQNRKINQHWRQIGIYEQRISRIRAEIQLVKKKIKFREKQVREELLRRKVEQDYAKTKRKLRLQTIERLKSQHENRTEQNHREISGPF